MRLNASSIIKLTALSALAVVAAFAAVRSNIQVIERVPAPVRNDIIVTTKRLIWYGLPLWALLGIAGYGGVFLLVRVRRMDRGAPRGRMAGARKGPARVHRIVDQAARHNRGKALE